jgi:hypothetical protein
MSGEKQKFPNSSRRKSDRLLGEMSEQDLVAKLRSLRSRIIVSLAVAVFTPAILVLPVFAINGAVSTTLVVIVGVVVVCASLFAVQQLIVWFSVYRRPKS